MPSNEGASGLFFVRASAQFSEVWADFRCVSLEKEPSRFTYELGEAPGKTVLAQVQECGKKHKPRGVKPAV